MTEPLTEAQRVARAHNARRALEEFLDPAFEAVVEAYAGRLEEIASKSPWEASKITALANAQRIAKEVRAQIVALVYDGDSARKEMIRVERIEKLSPAKRRLLQFGPY